MKKGRTSGNLEEGELEEDETISIGMVHGERQHATPATLSSTTFTIGLVPYRRVPPATLS